MIATPVELDQMAKKRKPPATPTPPVSPASDSEPASSETVRVSTDLMEMFREICFHTRDERNRRLKLTQYLDGLLRPIALREYDAFKKRQEEAG